MKSLHAASLAALALGLLLPAQPVLAQWRDRDGNVVADTEDARHLGKFGARLSLMTRAEYERFQDEWHNTPIEHGPTMVTTSTARRGDTVHTVITYGGCASHPDTATCDGSMTLRVLKPDGSVYFEQAGLPLAEGVPPSDNVVQLSPISLAIRFEPDDPLGMYRIEARVEDPLQHATLDLRTTITVADATAAP